MEEVVIYTKLFDCYGELLTEKEQEVFQDYYFENLSMQEIADNNRVTKSAVHKTLQSAIEKLDLYEKKLGINRKNDILNSILEYDDIEKIKNKIKEVIEI
ncbi:MAG: DNA-binding protein [Bacilli bacterium]|nr:DNA-binding protein [Bacilli bacterium]